MTLSFQPASFLQQEPTVERYFQTFNQGDFAATAQLFIEAGQLRPPLEDAIAGRHAICSYLQREAAGMQAFPQEMTIEQAEGDCRYAVVKGYVQTPLFGVNAAWFFELDDQDRICAVRVKLLASLQELLALRS